MLCEVCGKETSKYCCPKCGVQYCNLQCYRSHSAGCTDAFYRSNVEEELRRTSATKESKHEMLEILKRVYQHGQEEEEAEAEAAGVLGVDDAETETETETAELQRPLLLSEKSIQVLSEKFFSKKKKDGGGNENGNGNESGDEDDIDLDMAEIERLIPRSELDAFHRAALQGKLSHLVVREDWQPWWCTRGAAQLKCGKDGTPLIKAVPLSPEEEAEGRAPTQTTPSATASSSPSSSTPLPPSVSLSASSPIPKLPTKALPSLSDITRTEPSKDLPWHLVDLLYAYCFVHRMWEGHLDLNESRAQAAEEMCIISSVLTLAANPNAQSAAAVRSIASAKQAILGCMENVVTRSSKSLGLNYECSSSQRLEVVSDVATILGCGKACVICALEDTRCIMSGAAAHCKKKKKKEKNEKNEKKSIRIPSHKKETTSSSSSSSDEKRRLFKSLSHKLSYFLSWINGQSEEDLATLCSAIKFVAAHLLQQQEQEQEGEKKKSGRGESHGNTPWEVIQEHAEQSEESARAPPLIEEVKSL